MKEVLALIRKKKEEFEKLALFAFMQDTSIAPLERISWAPCLAPFAMCVKDLNNYVLRKEPADSLLQEMINIHTYEECTHWAWYLADLEKLGVNLSLPFTETLRFLWGNETQRTRQLCYDLAAICHFNDDPVLKLTVIECMETTGRVTLISMLPVCRELEGITRKRLSYFGEAHLKVELGHIRGSLKNDCIEKFLEAIELNKEQEKTACQIVEKVFASFSALIDEQMEYVQRHTGQYFFSTIGWEPKKGLRSCASMN
ncbi:hypothetical protein [Oscillatoria sp. FACHB-1406]|uniref:hypothetical protein n=1 Tax=Oscillatoria sp. FACHB-1406 TaxID=2692846 RepID=UPI00168947CF|nr:hypothetical protein [Oscillatoria sp. FACHB-1406]MBD2577357.1 hypothetical protein [Oscillatoria sp. FACHB-1406]